MTRPSVLLVEDDQTVASIYEAHLEPVCRVTVVHTGSAAVERFDDSIDIVLLDRKLPEMSGKEVAESLRRPGAPGRGIEDCHLAFLTALGPDLELLETEYDAYLTKPIRRNDLRTLIAYFTDDTEHLEKRDNGIIMAEGTG